MSKLSYTKIGNIVVNLANVDHIELDYAVDNPDGDGTISAVRVKFSSHDICFTGEYRDVARELFDSIVSGES